MRVTKEGLCAQTWVYANEGSGFDGLVAFFEHMNDDWRDWAGERQWSSLEGDLTLVARHEGHVRLQVALMHSADRTVRPEVTLAPGEELTGATRELADRLA